MMCCQLAGALPVVFSSASRSFYPWSLVQWCFQLARSSSEIIGYTPTFHRNTAKDGPSALDLLILFHLANKVFIDGESLCEKKTSKHRSRKRSPSLYVSTLWKHYAVEELHPRTLPAHRCRGTDASYFESHIASVELLRCQWWSCWTWECRIRWGADQTRVWTRASKLQFVRQGQTE